ncbi:carbonic anhydrase 1-like isoform X1 [Dermacentor variabilis]|uniref:carbonic anhydrase 1-like isoform X1 n=1 Tax=Dermacentor variabilis TaxID=34621 RepID=UPI003F5C6987
MLPSRINYRGQRGAPVSSVLLTTWLFCWSFHGSEQARRPMRRLVASRSLTPLGWGEYCDGTRWAYKTPQCGNATRADTVDTKNEAGWPAFESACGSPSQSPININFLQTSFKSFGPISFLGYNVPFRFAIENGGHALYITPLYAHLESYGGPLPARYNLSKGIFHFGNETSPRGSEHTIDDRNFAAELQLLVSSEKPTPTECIRRGQGLAIFVILFEKQEQNNPFLDTLVNASEHMTYRGNKTEVTMPLAYLLPNTTQHYYIYLGSLSFPPCTSDAFVVVFRSTVAIGEQQLSRLRNNLYTYTGGCKYRIAGNLRQLQPLGNRVVYRSFKFTPFAARSAASLPRPLIIAVALAAASFTIGIGLV